MVVGLGTFTACTVDDEAKGYTPATASGMQVYLSKDLTIVEVSKTESTYDIPVYRIDASEAATIPVEIKCDNEEYIFPEVIEFEAGEKESKITVTYDNESIEYEEYDSLYITIDPEYTTDYAPGSFAGLIGAPEPWTEWETVNSEGTCQWVLSALVGDDCVMEDLGLVTRTNEITGKIQFKVIGAFGNEEITEAAELSGGEEPVDIIIEVDPKTLDVTIPQQETGMTYSSLGDVYISDFDSWCIMKGYSNRIGGKFDPEAGTITVGVCYYLNAGYWAYGEETILFDGFDRKDFSLSATYLGTLTDEKGDVYAAAEVKLGADAAFGNAAVVPGELTQEIFSSIISGEYKPSRLFEKDGIVKVSMEDMESGDYNFVFVNYDADYNAQNYQIIQFKYTAGGATKETWTKLYTGSYTYSLVFTADAEGTPYVDEGLELYQSETDATKFKITPWGYGVDFIFHMDGDGNVLVDDQETGYSKDGYTIYVEDLVTAAGGKKDYGYSTYNQETGTFKFALCYYDNNNEIVEGGTGYETYVLDEEVKARVNRQLRAMKNKKVLAAAAKKTHKLHKDGSKLNVLTLPKIKFTK